LLQVAQEKGMIKVIWPFAEEKELKN